MSKLWKELKVKSTPFNIYCPRCAKKIDVSKSSIDNWDEIEKELRRRIPKCSPEFGEIVEFALEVLQGSLYTPEMHKEEGE